MIMVEISIVIPAYNEANRLPATVERIIQLISSMNIEYELILVNNASKDGTLEYMNSFASAHKNINVKVLSTPTKGKGLAVKTGMLSAVGKYVLFTDADLSTPIEEIEKLLPFVKEDYDVAYGTRAMKESVIVTPQPLHRRLLGTALKVILSFLIFTLPPRPTDTQCGFKMYKRDAVRLLFSRQTLDGGMFDVEIIYIGRKHHLMMKEVPVLWADDSKNSKVNIWKSMITNPAKLVGIRLKDILGYYR